MTWYRQHPDHVARTIARGLAGASADEDCAEKELLGLAGELREVKEQEARALDARVRDLISADVLAEKVADIRARQQGMRARRC